MNARLAGWIAIIVLCCATAAPATTITLYDGSLGTLPGSQGWLYLTNPFIGSTASQSVVGNATRLITTAAASSDSAGYFNNTHPSAPTLDNTLGYTVSVTARLNSETHSSANRAGFSLIVISDDNTKALEVGFWTNEVWVQSGASFTHAEGGTFNTAADFVKYDLTVLGNNYLLSADGSPILNGLMRDYTAFAGFPDPYEISNFIFFGDNTSSAYASVDIALFTVTLGVEDDAIIPEPTSACLLLTGIAVILRRRRVVI